MFCRLSFYDPGRSGEIPEQLFAHEAGEADGTLIEKQEELPTVTRSEIIFLAEKIIQRLK